MPGQFTIYIPPAIKHFEPLVHPYWHTRLLYLTVVLLMVPQEMTPAKIDLIMEYSTWVLEADPKQGLRVCV